MTRQKSKSPFYVLVPLIALGALAAAWFLYSRSHAQDTAPIAKGDTYQTVTVAEGLSFPWSLAFLPDNKGFLVTERDGKLLHITPDGKTKTEITGLPDIYAAGQSGLFDIALSPRFAKNKEVYFAFTEGRAGENNTALARAKLDLQKRRLTNVEVIFRATPKVKGNNHYGGRILFAPDGTLFLTLGDRFAYRDQAQSTVDHLGTIVRLNADGSIPADNPFSKDKQSKPEIFSYGHRNTQGIALQPGTNKIWAHEHGPKGGDEVNILKAGANYGWPVVTFGREYSGFEITDQTSAPGMEDSVIHWVPSIAPSGMAFYDGDKFPDWKGDLFVGALAGQHLRHLTVKDDKIISQTMMLTPLEERIRDVRNGPDGYIYVLTDNPDGRLIRIAPK
ncbi:MAG TPA: PQQ-dependent sugar dehydrogenase [Alphaproteobacteria bacterium]|jgi:glucose/arabinose dehydrogenase|nr:PQQ-dependent sugar dehydrogenase [Alphaproteobacteria bacterium]